ncbi:hypothetical protein [Shouchella lonarensis]|uniref:Collagen triple helix repeat-containing protein n=1 Tax=Shouchella lonarensis TaxID=1464122 RepID=A0A1G6II19_9BACI|nr:hypothetical protein [Shouchella lonarensis]SDC06043.1 Collagen triple helix repeat-containing protein [Shouchella lonarensis]
MTRFKAVVKQAVTTNRLLSVVQEGGIKLQITPAGGTPDFYSTRALEANEEITVTVNNAPVWDVEAGADIAAGANVEAGEGGTLVTSSIGKGIGYVPTGAKAGDVVQLVRRGAGGAGKDGRDGKDGKDGVNGKDGIDGKNGADGKDGKDGKDGAAGEVTKAQLDAAIAAAKEALRKELKGDGE